MASGARYAGKVVVVTGAARGIGAGIARAFVDSGAQVVICDKDERGGRALEQELRRAVFIRCDVTREEDVRALLSDTVHRFGRLDCVVNNAGSHPPLQPLEETTAQGFRELLELNLLGTYTLCKLALPHLRRSRGNIINISSLVGAVGQLQGVPYAATKGAVTALTKALALDESQYGVRVNCISPGNIWTPLWQELAALAPDPRAAIREGAMAQIWARKLLPVPWLVCGPRRCASSNFKAADLQLQMTAEPQKKPNPSEPLMFGKTFTDHMLMVEWTGKKGWGQPRIQPFQNLTLHPACSALHYSLQLFEGMKAFKGKDQQVRLFRPWLNMERMLRSARRLCLPSFDKAELLECIRRLIRVDKDWVPEGSGTSLYVRPVLIGNEPSLGVGGATQALLFVILCPVGSYFPGDAVTPVSLLADPTFIRAWMGGVGDYKLGGNYGPTVYVQREAQKRGCEQVLWLYGPDHQLTEVGTMNIFIYWTHEDGVLELVTPPLDGIILPGVIRQSLLDLAQSWGEFRVAERAITMKELLRALKEGRVREVFGSGTACQVCPVHQILYEGQAVHIPTMEHGPELILRFQKELQAIQYGTSTHEWMLPV